MAIFGQKKRLGDQLIEAGLLTQEQLESALLEQKNMRHRDTSLQRMMI